MTVLKYAFAELFKENTDGSLTPLKAISINGIVIGPGVSFAPGVLIGGVDFYKLKNLPLAAEEKDGTLIITGYFPTDA